MGSHLCERLLAEGWEVLCVDNFRTSGGENIAHLKSLPEFTFIRHDITKPISIRGPINYVLHFACPASPKDYLQ